MTHRTFVSEMQAICRRCNRVKGKNQMRKRAHQLEAEAKAIQFAQGKWPKKTITCDVSPGGGKTGLSIVMGHTLLSHGAVDQVIHLVPRTTLREQVARAWIEMMWLNTSGFELYETDNRLPLYVRDRSPLLRSVDRPLVGIVASYDQLSSLPEAYIDLAKERRTVLFADECQFLGDKDRAAWAKHTMALAEHCHLVVSMSGTIWRHDEKLIPLLEYGEPDGQGRRLAVSDIQYSIANGIADGALKELEFRCIDADVRFHLNGDSVDLTLSEAPTEQEGRAISTYVQRAETWKNAIDRCVEHWRRWKENVYPSKIIVVATRVEDARLMHKYMVERHRLDAVIAVAEDEDAHTTLSTFRGNKNKAGPHDALVTVAMASVGFDVPCITHMVYLSNIRSIPYAVQVMMRAGRADPQASAMGAPPSAQRGFVWCPDDRRMRAVIQWLKNEQRRGARESMEEESSGDDKGSTESRDVFIPLSAKPTRVSYDSRNGALSSDDAHLVEAIWRQRPDLAHLPTDIVLAIAKAAKAADVSVDGGQVLPDTEATEFDLKTARERETELRQSLSRVCKMRDAQRDVEYGSTEKELMFMHGPVHTRSLATLRDNYQWVIDRINEEKIRGDG